MRNSKNWFIILKNISRMHMYVYFLENILKNFQLTFKNVKWAFPFLTKCQLSKNQLLYLPSTNTALNAPVSKSLHLIEKTQVRFIHT